MSSAMIKPSKFMKRAESRKSHSWWWDSHISPKNSKWLSENLEEMDQSVKRMLKLIEEDADSFAKKAEMYYQKRPQLVTHVEEFYRMYRSLAERYDQLTGELLKSMPKSGISEMSSESRRGSGSRRAGVEGVLGSDDKEGEESSESDSESDEDSGVLNEEELLRRRVAELENELHEAKEKILHDKLGESIIEEVSELEIERYKMSLSDRDQEIRELKESINNANRTLLEENSRIQSEIAKLSNEKTLLEDNLKELDLRRASLEEDVRRIRDGNVETEEKLNASLKARDELGSRIVEVVTDLNSKTDLIEHMESHLKQMHMEQIELLAKSKQSCKQIEELKEEIEKQNVLILEGAEGKREAIRQLCFSIDHYRNDYRELFRLAFPGQNTRKSGCLKFIDLCQNDRWCVLEN